MPRKADLSGTTLPRRQLGRALRDARQARGLTLDQVAAATGVSRATLSRIELGQYEKVRDMEVDYLSRYYCLPDARIQYLKALARQANNKVWYHGHQHSISPMFSTYLELESFASEVWFYQPVFIPGLCKQPTMPELCSSSAGLTTHQTISIRGWISEYSGRGYSPARTWRFVRSLFCRRTSCTPSSDPARSCVINCAI